MITIDLRCLRLSPDLLILISHVALTQVVALVPRDLDDELELGSLERSEV